MCTHIRARITKPSTEREGLGAGYLVALITRILSRIHPYSGTVAQNSTTVFRYGATIGKNSGTIAANGGSV